MRSKCCCTVLLSAPLCVRVRVGQNCDSESVKMCVSGQGRAQAGLFLQIQARFCNLIFHCLHIWSCM